MKQISIFSISLLFNSGTLFPNKMSVLKGDVYREK